MKQSTNKNYVSDSSKRKLRNRKNRQKKNGDANSDSNENINKNSNGSSPVIRSSVHSLVRMYHPAEVAM